MTFNGAEDHCKEAYIKRSFIIWFNILRSRETKLHWFILSSLNVYDTPAEQVFFNGNSEATFFPGLTQRYIDHLSP